MAEQVSEEEISKDEYKPSFVYSVLAAVSGTVPQVKKERAICHVKCANHVKFYCRYQETGGDDSKI